MKMKNPQYDRWNNSFRQILLLPSIWHITPHNVPLNLASFISYNDSLCMSNRFFLNRGTDIDYRIKLSKAKPWIVSSPVSTQDFAKEGSRPCIAIIPLPKVSKQGIHEQRAETPSHTETLVTPACAECDVMHQHR